LAGVKKKILGYKIFEVKGGRYKGVFFQTPEQAVKSLSRMRQYERWLEGEGFL